VLLVVELAAKQLEVLHELLRTSAAVAMLVNPNTPVYEPSTKGVRDAARSLGLQLHVLDASTEGEIDAAFEKLIEVRAGGLVVIADPFLTSQPLKSWRWRPATRCRQFTDCASSPPVAA
jgi:putative ABC transport system substrate-binding protein